jgi:hypothetical protein
MTNPVWPDNLCPQGAEWRLRKAGTNFRSPYSGSFQAVDFASDWWEVGISLRGEGVRQRNTGQLEALLMHLAGGVNQVDVYRWTRPFPRGTLRGAPTVRVVTVVGDLTVSLTVAAGATLLAGDMIGIGDQLFMVRLPCAAVGTTLDVTVVNRVRTAIAESTPVVWNRPKLSVVAPELNAGLVSRPGVTLPTEILLTEP